MINSYLTLKSIFCFPIRTRWNTLLLTHYAIRIYKKRNIKLPALLIKISNRLYLSWNLLANSLTEERSSKAKSSKNTFWLFVTSIILSRAAWARLRSLHARITVAPLKQEFRFKLNLLNFYFKKPLVARSKAVSKPIHVLNKKMDYNRSNRFTSIAFTYSSIGPCNNNHFIIHFKSL